MKFICIADIHLSMYYQDRIIKGLPERLYYLKNVLTNISEYAISNEIKNIVIAGDVFHTKSIIHSLAQSILLDYINNNGSIDFSVIDGNHDMSSKSGEGVSALKCLDNCSNVNMIHEPCVYEDIIFVPWDPRTMRQTIKESTQSYLVSHFGINEAMLNSGISIVSDIKAKDLAHFKKCFVGHYHVPQEFANIHIPGSIIQLDWGEKGEKKRFLIVDTEDDSVESVETSGYKQHIEIDLDTNDPSELSEIYEKAKSLKDEGHEIKFNLMKGDIDISPIKEDFRVIDKVEKDITNRGINTAMSKEDILNRYIEIREIPEEKREIFLHIGKELIDATQT